jgi:hypothetical protein
VGKLLLSNASSVQPLPVELPAWGRKMTHISEHQFMRWSNRFRQLDLQIYRLSLACDVNLAQVGVVESVIANISTVCGKDKPRAFFTLRALLTLRYSLQMKAVVELGSRGTLLLSNYSSDWLRVRVEGRGRSALKNNDFRRSFHPAAACSHGQAEGARFPVGDSRCV